MRNNGNYSLHLVIYLHIYSRIHGLTKKFSASIKPLLKQLKYLGDKTCLWYKTVTLNYSFRLGCQDIAKSNNYILVVISNLDLFSFV